MIEEALDAYLLATADEREPDGYFHPSSLFSCDRMAVYEQTGMPRSDAKAGKDYIPLEMGKLIHTLLQSSVTHMADTERVQEVWHEVKVIIPPLNVKGSADSLIRFEDGSYEVEEFKSTKSAGIKYAKGGFKPKEEHVNQGLTYTYGMRYFPWYTEHTMPDGTVVTTRHEPIGARLTRLRVTYFGKDAGEILEFPYTITPEWEAWFVEFMRKLNGAEELPDRKPEKDWLCKGYCSWRSLCWGKGE